MLFHRQVFVDVLPRLRPLLCVPVLVLISISKLISKLITGPVVFTFKRCARAGSALFGYVEKINLEKNFRKTWRSRRILLCGLANTSLNEQIFIHEQRIPSPNQCISPVILTELHQVPHFKLRLCVEPIHVGYVSVIIFTPERLVSCLVSRLVASSLRAFCEIRTHRVERFESELYFLLPYLLIVLHFRLSEKCQFIKNGAEKHDIMSLALMLGFTSRHLPNDFHHLNRASISSPSSIASSAIFTTLAHYF